MAFEAACGWGWPVELLEDNGFAPHLVHPLRCKAIASARLNSELGRGTYFLLESLLTLTEEVDNAWF